MKKKKLKISLIVIGVVLILGGLFYYFFLGPKFSFEKQEKDLLEAGKLYFERNSYLMPAEGNARSVDLETLYDQSYLDTFYIPNSKKICNSKTSFVTVRKKDDAYQYAVYLSCGKYESKQDHLGPKITLNGEMTVTLSKGEEYKEEGIKQVQDDYDGTMKIENVDIDSSKVDSNKIGTYEVVYTAYDSWKNKTVVTRTVKVVQKLKDTVKKDTDGLGYYIGGVENNYLTFNAMTWRIVGTSKEGITIVMDEPVANVDYTLAKNNEVKGSSLDQWLNDYFYSKLSNEAKKMIVKNSSWCTDKIKPENINTKECKTTTKMNVGLISIQDFNKSLDVTSYSYLGQEDIVSWMLNPSTTSQKAYTQRNDYFYLGRNYMEDNTSNLFGVCPAVKLKDDVLIIDGTGSKTDPYTLGELPEASRNDLLNTRAAGEYVTYSGYIFRIVEVAKDGTVHVIQDGVLGQEGNPVDISYPSSNVINIYNPKAKGNIGYIIANQMTQYIKTSYFASKNIKVPIYKKNALYGKEDETKTYKVKLAAPNTFDLFSVKGASTGIVEYWYINSSRNKGQKYIAGSNGTVYEGDTSEYNNASVKVSAYFDKNVKIKEGNGSYTNPYKLTK